MSTLSVTSAPSKARRRRHSQAFKSEVVAACRQPGASVSRVALDHDLNANLVRRWIREAQAGTLPNPSSPGFMPLPLASNASVSSPPTATQDSGASVRIELPSSRGPVVVHWPVDQAEQCLPWLQSLLQ